MTAALADRLRQVLRVHTTRTLKADFARSDFLRDHGAELLRIVEEHERDREDAARFRWLLEDAEDPAGRKIDTPVALLASTCSDDWRAEIRELIDAARGHGGG